jgi:hypothetical protein
MLRLPGGTREPKSSGLTDGGDAGMLKLIGGGEGQYGVGRGIRSTGRRGAHVSGRSIIMITSSHPSTCDHVVAAGSERVRRPGQRITGPETEDSPVDLPTLSEGKCRRARTNDAQRDSSGTWSSTRDEDGDETAEMGRRSRCLVLERTKACVMVLGASIEISSRGVASLSVTACLG